MLLLIASYYAFDAGMMLAILTLLQRQPPWQVWWQAQRGILVPELAACTIGILVAVAWWYDPILLALFVLPVVALRLAFKAIGQAEDRAAALRHQGEQLKLVLDAGQSLKLQHSQMDILQPVAEAARTLVGAASAAAYLRDEENPGMLQRVVLTPPDALVAGPSHVPIPVPGAGIRELAEPGHALLIPLEPDGGGAAGLLRLTGLAAPLNADDRDALAILATQATIALQNAHMHERALAQASEDGLTGVLNHRAFQTRLEEEVARAKRGHHPLALMMVDLDDFKEVNNSYGHQSGDLTLQAVAAAIRDSVRVSDIPARYGGDEFVVILPETEMEEALAAAERARSAVAALRLSGHGPSIRISASIGVAAMDTHAATREELVRAADNAAYAAKHAGKGRVGRPEDVMLALDRDPDVLAAQLEHANMATVEALAAAVDAKDPYTRGHSQRVSQYAVAIAQAMGLSPADVARVRLAGLLHDVGKIGVPDAVLTKAGKLTPEEFAAIKQHPEIGERMLAGVPFLREALPAVRHHHERWDGKGYPDGLAGNAIPDDAAVLMVADSFDAMTSTRTYRPALPPSEARRRLREGSGTQFDPRVVAAFGQAVAEGLLVPLVPTTTPPSIYVDSSQARSA